MPYALIHPWLKALMTVSVEMSFIGTAAGHLVKRSIIVRRYLYPAESGIIVMSA